MAKILIYLIGLYKENAVENKKGITKMKTWVDEIVEKAYSDYRGRKIVIWGYYQPGFKIESEMNKRYHLSVDRYVDGNVEYVDNRRIFLPDILDGKSDDYYVIIPLVYNQSIKDRIKTWGYNTSDYFYFNDCIVENNKYIYLDEHGNTVKNPPHNVKFVFRGYNNHIEFSEEYSFFSNVTITVESDNKVIIKGGGKYRNINMYLCNNNEMIIHENCEISDLQMTLCKNNVFQIDRDNKLSSCLIFIGDNCLLKTGRRTHFQGKIKMLSNSEISIGNDSIVVADMTLHESGKISYGDDVEIGGEKEHHIAFQQSNIFLISEHGEVSIGDGCLFSIGIKIICGDGHSIFDIETGENVNSGNGANNRIILENNVWIGEDVTLVQGTHIGTGSIVGTRSVVNKVYPENCIIAGIPAKVIQTNRTWDKIYGLDVLPRREK